MDKLDLEAKIDALVHYARLMNDFEDDAEKYRRLRREIIADIHSLQSLPQGGAPEIDPCRPKGARVPEKWIETYAENDSWGPVIQALARDLMDMTVAYGSAMKKLEAQGTARIQEAGTGAPGVREAIAKMARDEHFRGEDLSKFWTWENLVPEHRERWLAFADRIIQAMAPDKQAQKEGA